MTARAARPSARARPSLRRWIGERLEIGAWSSPLPRLASRAWAWQARVERRVALPPAAVIGVSGATLGGSGTTDVVLALARFLAAGAYPVAVAAHCYRGRLRGAERVGPRADPGRVGDEARWLAQALAPLGVPVFSGPSRVQTLEAAARGHSIVVADALLQARPVRLAQSLLVVDGAAPWGAGFCPPAGDLRARPAALLAAADLVVATGPVEPAHVEAIRRATGTEPCVVTRESRGIVTPEGRVLPWERVARVRVGVVLAIARPERVIGALAARGVRPRRIVLVGDHDRLPESAPFRREPTVSAWLTTQKCATKLGPRYRGAPVWVIDYSVRLPEALTARIARLSAETTAPGRCKASGASPPGAC